MRTRAVMANLAAGVLVYAAMAACGASGKGTAESTADAETLNTSGSRLKARYYLGADGSRQFAGFYDTQRKEVCTFQPLTGSDVYCVPFSTVDTSEFFTENACLQGLTLPPSGGINYVRFGLDLRKYGSAYTGKVYTRTRAGDCVEYTPGIVLYTLGEKVPLAELVSAKTIEETNP